MERIIKTNPLVYRYNPVKLSEMTKDLRGVLKYPQPSKIAVPNSRFWKEVEQILKEKY